MTARWISAPIAVVVSLAIGFGAVEILVRSLGLFADARAFYADVEKTSGPPKEDAPALQSQIHPFLGWIRRPGVEVPHPTRPIPTFPNAPPSEWAKLQTRTNQFGYLSSWDDYRDIPADHFVIGIFGGSVAGQLAQLAGDVLRDALRERLPEIQQPIEVLCFGSGGYKQPQQLMALSQMVTLGVPLDLVVTLDGFNELVFGLLDARSKRHPVFPSRSHYKTTVDLALSVPSRRQTELSGRIVYEKRLVAEPVQYVEERPLLRWSVTAQAIAGALAERHATAAVLLEEELQRVGQSGSQVSALAGLPVPCAREADGCLALVVDLWANASKAMQALATSIGARYVHALQPNQYVEGSKPLNAEEREFAFREGDAAQSVRLGYGTLQARGEQLRAEGVPFFDLTQVFAGHEETLYRDDCCHMNAEGNAILARALADAIVAALHAAPADQRK